MDFTKKDKLRLLEKALRLCLFCHGYLSDIESVEMKSTLIWSPLFPHKIFSQEISDRQVPPSLSLSIWIYLPPPPLCLTHSLLTIFEAPTPCSHLGSLVTLVLLFFFLLRLLFCPFPPSPTPPLSSHSWLSRSAFCRPASPTDTHWHSRACLQG